MRLWWLVPLMLLLAGCAAPGGDKADGVAGQEKAASGMSVFAATSHVEPTGGLEVTFTTKKHNHCGFLLAAHHETGSSRFKRVHVEVQVGDDRLFQYSPRGKAPGDSRIAAGPADTGYTKDHVDGIWTAAAQAVGWHGETFTTWFGFQRVPVMKGESVRLLVHANGALVDGGTGATEGGSLHLRVACDHPVASQAREDPTALWVGDHELAGDTMAYAVFATVHAGSFAWTTEGEATELELESWYAEGTLDVAGALEGSFDLGGLTSAESVVARTTAAGDFVLSWDYVAAMGPEHVPGFALGLWSWGEPWLPEPREAPDWPWDQ